MNEPKRRFFSGDSLQQALVQAANHFNLAPEEIEYRSIEKRHGFLKTRRKVVIEVNPDAPRREAGAPRPVPAPAPAPAAPPAAAAPAPAPRPAPPPRPEAGPRSEGDPDDNRGNRIDRRDDRSNPDDRGNRVGRDDRGNRDPRGGRGRGGEGRRSEDPHRRRPSAPRYEREPGPSAAAAMAASPAGAPPAVPLSGGMPGGMAREMPGGGGLVTLPDTPRRPSERYPAAEGPMAEAAGRGVEILLRIAGLDLAPRILQGEDRLEVDLSGADVDWCFADDGEFVMAVEHLLPRIIRSLSGESTLVRVDCDNFQEIREERLRSLAQQVAEEVRRRGKPRTLEPMNPADRRIVHMTLADDPGVVTESEGDGYFKRITVRPA
jgi:spoIIIJ-associated protein